MCAALPVNGREQSAPVMPGNSQHHCARPGVCLDGNGGQSACVCRYVNENNAGVLYRTTRALHHATACFSVQGPAGHKGGGAWLCVSEVTVQNAHGHSVNRLRLQIPAGGLSAQTAASRNGVVAVRSASVSATNHEESRNTTRTTLWCSTSKCRGLRICTQGASPRTSPASPEPRRRWGLDSLLFYQSGSPRCSRVA